MSDPRERPIPFSEPMVRAILDGSKTQTRRVINRVLGVGRVTEFHRSDTDGYDWIMRDNRLLWNDLRNVDLLARCPYGGPGDLLWARETWRQADSAHILDRGTNRAVHYRADLDEPPAPGCWHSSRHMPRWASRITLEVVAVRVERVQDISEDDARAEGHPAELWRSMDNEVHRDAARDWFMDTWDSINKKPRSLWADNPWVWVIEFKRVKS